MTGNSTWGKGATGRKLNASAPAMSSAIASSEVPIGRLINGAEIFIGSSKDALVRSRSVRGRSTRFLDGIANLEARETLRQPIEPEIHNRRGVERKQLAHQQAAYNRDAQRVAQLRSGAGSEGERQAAQQCRHGGHHDGTETQQASLKDGFFRGLMFHALGFEREVDHHDGVLLHDSNQKNDAN